MLGKKTGGRQKGSKNKTTMVREKQLARGGLLPLEYMLKIMRDQTAEVTRRDDMAKAAAAYVHPRLASVEHSGEIATKAAELMSDDELAAVASAGSSHPAQAPVDPSKLN